MDSILFSPRRLRLRRSGSLFRFGIICSVWTPFNQFSNICNTKRLQGEDGKHVAGTYEVSVRFRAWFICSSYVESLTVTFIPTWQCLHKRKWALLLAICILVKHDARKWQARIPNSIIKKCLMSKQQSRSEFNKAGAEDSEDSVEDPSKDIRVKSTALSYDSFVVPFRSFAPSLLPFEVSRNISPFENLSKMT